MSVFVILGNFASVGKTLGSMRGAACSYFRAFASSSVYKQVQYHCCARYCAASNDAEHLLALLDSKTAHPSF